MEIIVTSESTALIVMRSDARTGRPTRIKLLALSDEAGTLQPAIRPTTIKTRTGKPMVPNAPSGSRRKILISIQVNFQSPRSSIVEPTRWNLFANRMTGQFEKNVFKIGENGTEIRDPDAILGKTMNYFGHQVVATAANRESQVSADYRLHSRDRAKAFFYPGVIGGKYHGSLRAVPGDESFRSVDVDNPSVLDDCYSIAQAFGFLHQMSGQENGFTALANAAHEFPDGPA